MSSKPTVFISCGQFTDAEKKLGSKIAEMVRSISGLEPFFAENVHDLNGLDENILSALRDCAGFIVVMHPRGEVERPDKTTLTRASVWIEQEIAIATYIQRVEKRPLQIAAFKHRDVGREGLREFLHLNPTEFSDESEVVNHLSGQLPDWKPANPKNIWLELKSETVRVQDGHRIRQLSLLLFNESNERIANYDFETCIPEGLLKHWSTIYPGEIKPSQKPNFRCFRGSQEGRGPILPHERKLLTTFDYCTECGVIHHALAGINVAEQRISARAWMNNREYVVDKSTREMAIEAEQRKA